MNLKTGMRCGQDAAEDTFEEAGGLDGYGRGKPYINKWYTCYRCKGKRDQYGNVSQSNCQLCWPPTMHPPV